MQHRRQPLPAYSGATTLRHDDDKHAKHLHARTRKLWIAAAVVGIVVLVMGARALLLPSLVEVEVTHSTTTDPARPQYVHPLDDRSATRRAVEASTAALRRELSRAYGQAQKRVRARKNRAAPPPPPAEEPRPARAVAAAAARGAVDGLAAGGEVVDGTTRRRAMDVLVARVDATRDEAARQAAIDAGGAARQAYRANDFCDAVPAPKTPHTLRVASLNLWQPAADTWPRRRAALARLLRDADVDVVALQEARGDPRWVDELREACAAEGLEFPHSRYVPGTGGGAGGAAPPGWAEEGVGVLSKFPLPRDDDALAPMPPAARSSDRNPRTALGVLAATPFGNLRVVAAHLSYDRRQQCDSVSTILRPWLDALWGREEALGQVVVGDLNTYPDYEWPLDALTLEPEILRLVGGPCAADAPLVLEGPPFVDAWARTRPLDAGATFPNPETMNLDAARPDRVLARGLGLRPRAAAVLGCDFVEGAKGHAPSDHRLLVVDLEVVAP